MAKVWRFTLEGTDGDSGQRAVHSLHYQTDVPVAGTEPSAATVLDNLLNHYSTSGHNLLSWAGVARSVHVFTRATVREEVATPGVDVGEAAQEELAIAGTQTIGSNLLPSAICPWISLKGSEAIRSARGGVHLPPTLNEAVLNAHGVYSTTVTYWTNVLALAAKIKDPLNDVFSTTGDINPVIYSRTRRSRALSFTFAIDLAVPSIQPRWLRQRQEF